MNKDQVKGKAKEVGGKIQQKVGEVVGSSEQQLKGMKNQAEGNIQQKAGDVKEAAKDIAKDRGNR
ncbi:CsbD family protein [Massilia sp. RP-1-19]|uniref:CsbD family protein n=1 Tax=Massilia polaris TaxID=2728846 RepID=A0A848HTL0_9BURK|nr:CsbD family protein [Massilia polaris]NML62018.1 CsbD family protein [Massilia polaris]